MIIPENTLPPWNATPNTNNFERTLKKAKLNIHSLVALRAQNNWTAICNNKQEIKPKLSKWKTSIRENRKEEVIIARIRIGHTNLTHSSLFKDGSIPICDTCKTPTTVKHLLLDCIKYTEERGEIFGENVSLIKILGDQEEDIAGLLLFLRNTNLETKI